MIHRASVYLNTGRWAEAAVAAASGFVAALAHFETGRRREAVAAFLHAALHRPRAARMIVGMRTRRAPSSREEALDHNAGVNDRRDLHAYLRDRRRPSLRFFTEMMKLESVAGLLNEIEQVVERWRTEKGTREAFDRMNVMRGAGFAAVRAQEVADELGLPREPTVVAKSSRRGKASPAAPVH